MRRKLFSLISLFILSLVLLTCSSNQTQNSFQEPQSEKVLTIWWNRGYYLEEDQSLEKVVTEWQEKTDNKVELLFFSPDDILQVVIDALATGKPPDIFFSYRAEYTLIPQWVWQGKLLDVSDVIAPVKNLYNNTALKSVYWYNNVESKFSNYAVPIMQRGIHVHYWYDLIRQAGLGEEIPQKWDEFWQFWQKAQKVLRQQGQDDIYALGLPMSIYGSDTYFIFEQILEANNLQIVDERGKLQIDKPGVRQKIIEVLDWYTSFYKNGYVPPNAVNWINSDNNTNFLNRKTLMTINPTMSIPGSQQEDEEIYLNKMRTIEFPHNPNGTKSKYLVSVKQLVVFTSSAHPKLAKEFLSYLVQPENLGAYIKGAKGRYFPIMPQLWEDPFWKNTKDPHISVASQQFTKDQIRLFNNSINPAYSQIDSENIWGKAMQQILIEGKSPTEATDLAINRIKEIFSQWKTQIKR
ncbi:MAG: carbohydrate ABC transporter substrate-binding protein [Okeania sp. SIO3I5]|uniref:ABC transporter substrate-binding protein n=1 Tax=Okeania sp. SIO3I5 TaxID=2607805 RepID=UPI0013BB4D94|nr:ABC transporter substrate-binding protein [Okeania sp. SIO3I5]NEQ35919.1 carbohydrate ABC transporter substrate-binding protein [Okeania sp. SIO3I5]